MDTGRIIVVHEDAYFELMRSATSSEGAIAAIEAYGEAPCGSLISQVLTQRHECALSTCMMYTAVRASSVCL